MVYQEHTRRRLRVSLLLLAVLGLCMLGFGLAAPSLAPDVPPVPVLLGTPTTLPSPGPFGGSLTLYGNSGSESNPGLDDLGCSLRTDEGEITEAELSERGVANLDRRVVAGQALLPLVAIRGAGKHWQIVCDGAAAIDVQPLYLITTTGQRDLVPMAAFSIATLALALGIAGTIVFRPLES